MNKNIDCQDSTNYTLKDREKKNLHTVEQEINQKDNNDENVYVEKLDKNIYEEMNNKYVKIDKDTYEINEKDKDKNLWYNNQFIDDVNLIQSIDVEKKCPIIYSEETKQKNNKMLRNDKEEIPDIVNKNISNHDEPYNIESNNFVNYNMKYIKEEKYKERKKKKKYKKEKNKKGKKIRPVQKDSNTIFLRTNNNESRKYNIIQNMLLYNDKHFNKIFDKTVKEFEVKIDKLNEEELKNKITQMFVKELVSEKYNDILLEEEKGTLKKVLTIKYKNIFLKKQKKYQKYIKRFLLKKLKKDEKILKENYEKEKEKFQKYLMNIKNEELEKEKNKIQNMNNNHNNNNKKKKVKYIYIYIYI
ncbi:hypothetical protein PFFCH_01791 [Plasmodium falciparum FCH/4]|uniref:Uncharacterized protein n=1 Tax=Plasmodium falciparum FCH/4 TaxID=1036724 RepID=A0A024VS97_PLAFA|nr:hypothetical protein PFFCH_01791 [Plasmodium falciparum FCH/4]